MLAVRQFVEKDVVPVAAGARRAPARSRALWWRSSPSSASSAPWSRAEHGGLGLDLATTAMIVEELARGWATLAARLAAPPRRAGAIARFARSVPRERERLLPAMARGERLDGAVCAGRIHRRAARGRRTGC